MAWVCTVDLVTDADDHKSGLPSRVGWRSRDWPDDLPPDVNQAAALGKKLSMWRCKDADGEVYYEGVADADPINGGEELFAPLDDFAMPDAGAVEIQYWTKGRWETI